MNKRLGFIFIIAICTGAGIIIFQVYWMLHTFKITEDNFYTIASNALQKSINSYQIKQNNRYLNFKPGDSTVSVSMDAKQFPDSLSPIKKTVPINNAVKNHLPFQPSQGKVHLTGANMEMVKTMMARMMAQLMAKPVDLNDLKPLFANELKKNKIDLPFFLSLKSINNTNKLYAHVVVGYPDFSKNSSLVYADFKLSRYYFIKHDLVSLSVSLFLIILTAGCLWYMWYVIRQQVRLDDIKNNFINNMTHELRTPVSILKSTHEALDKFGEVEDKEKTLRYLKINQSVLIKLENNIDRILDITRCERNKKLANLEPIQLESYIKEIIDRFYLNISFTYELDAAVISDRYIIDTIVSNLIDNALKYKAITDPEIKLAISRITNGWELKIQDNGLGIDAQYLPFIFDKFYRVPTGNLHDVKGFGLGLSYVKELTGLLNGKIFVQSKPGVGTTFTIQFPSIWKK